MHTEPSPEGQGQGGAEAGWVGVDGGTPFPVVFFMKLVCCGPLKNADLCFFSLYDLVWPPNTEKQVTRYAQLASNILCCHHAPRCNDLFSETEEDKQATQEINEQKGERVCKCPPWDLVLHCRLM